MENTGNITDTFEEVATRYENFYPIYKDQLREPFVRIHKGYKGVVLKDKFDGKVMCNDCGVTFKKLAPHVIAEHDYESLAQYKERNGLAQNIPLCTDEVSERQREIAIKYDSNRNIAKYRTSGKGLPKRHKYTVNPISKRNKHGTCSPEQLRQRLIVVAGIVKRTPYHTDLRKYDSSMTVLLKNAYGSLSKAYKALGFKFKKKDMRKHTKESLIGNLRKFVIKHKKAPTVSGRGHTHFTREYGKCANVYVANFGSWRRAKMMAGLDQLLEEVKSK